MKLLLSVLLALFSSIGFTFPTGISGSKSNSREIGLSAQEFTPEAFGAKGNGVTDDAAAFSAMISAMPTRGGLIHLSAKTYLINSSIIITKPCIIEGEGSNKSVLKGVTSTKIITNKGSINLFECTVPNITFRDLNIECTAPNPTAGCGILNSLNAASITPMHDFGGFGLVNVTVNGFYDCVNIENGFNWTIDKCLIVGAKRYGIYIRDVKLPDAGDACISNSWINTGTSYAGVSGIRYETGGGLKLINVKFNMDFTGRNKYQHLFDMNFTGHSVDLLLSNCSFENSTDQAIKIRTPNTGSFENISITGCQFAPVADGDNMIDIDGIGGNVGVIAISNNTFNAIFKNERAIRIANAHNVTIGYNAYKKPIANNSFINVTNLRTAPGEE